MDTEGLATIASTLAAPGKGILAADESTPTMGKRLEQINADSTFENRRRYRTLLFSAPGLEVGVSGVILYDETLRQTMDDGTPVPDYLNSIGIVPGIKVDTGAKDLAAFPGEKVTEGLDGLRERLAEYYRLGARFAKWRAVIRIADGLPTAGCIHANAHALARYSALCQEAGLVPIVEPEVLMDGEHDIDICFAVTERTLNTQYSELDKMQVYLKGTLLKPNMILPGMGCQQQATVEEVAQKTVDCLNATVPPAVPGVMFLSGGQSDIEATAHLNAMNAMQDEHPWELSYSYGRAMQHPALVAWAGEESNVEAAQSTISHRAKMNSLARSGDWSEDLED